ncbi:MAG: MarR family transcriptional regulator [Microbacterium sp.]
MTDHQRIEWGIRALITGGALCNHQVADRLGLHVIDLQVLNLLAMAGGQLTPSALADAMRTPRTSVSRIVRRLEEAGYVSRRESPTDRRSVTVEIDHDRLAAVTSEYRRQSDHLSEVLSAFTPTETTVIARFLESLTSR